MVEKLSKLGFRGIGARLRDLVGRHRKAALRAAAGTAGVLIVLLVHRSAYDLLGTSPQFGISTHPAIVVAPAWGMGTHASVTLPAPLDLLDDATVEGVGRTLEANPWVRRVTSVERLFPDQIRVRFEPRRPTVAVRRPDGLLLVDRDGVVLPGTYPSVPTGGRLVELVGVQGAPPAAGRRWSVAEISAGLELTALVDSTPALRALDIRAVDVTNVGGRADRRRPETALVTARGCTIYWGGAPSSGPRLGELPPAGKLDLLAAVLREYPNLEGVQYVKVHAGRQAAVSLADTRVGRRTPR